MRFGQGEDTSLAGIRKQAMRAQDTLPATCRQMARPTATGQALELDLGAQSSCQLGTAGALLRQAQLAFSGTALSLDTLACPFSPTRSCARLFLCA